MGEVYRARDERLGRDVAVKILPREAAENAERLARFEQEARAVCALQHPNLLVLHDIGRHEGRPFLVSELLDGETLESRLERGPIPWRRTAAWGAEIARGLAAAHGAGVIHRDLKPANLFLTRDGRLKILDFGLAKLTAESLASGAPTEAETASLPPQTRAEVLLGTVGYMAPEQIRGEPADARTDIFVLGGVLFEMLSGRRAFRGDDRIAVLDAVLRQNLDPEEVPSEVPPALRAAVCRCLEKRPERRFQSCDDLAFHLESLALPTTSRQSEAASAGPPGESHPSETTSLGVTFWRWATAALTLALVGSWILRIPGGGSDVDVTGGRSTVTRHIVSLPAEQQIVLSTPGLPTPSLALSPDGRRLVHVGLAAEGGTQLYIRDLDEFEASPIPGTEGGFAPFVSPDGAWVGFFRAGELRRVSIAGGSTMRISATSSRGQGADWLADGTIVFSPGVATGLMRVLASGGTPEPLTVPDAASGEVGHVYPQVLPNGKDLLFGVQTPRGYRVAALSAETGEWHMLVDGLRPRYLPTGHLLFSRGDSLWAVPFNLEALELDGSPRPVIDGIRPVSIGGGDYAVSDGGSLAYVPGTHAQPRTELVWANRSGRRTSLNTQPAAYRNPRLSPDGTQVAFDVYSPEALGSSIWVSEWEAGRRTRLNVEGNIELYPAWTPDGTHLTFTTARPGGRLHWARADGGGEAERLSLSPIPQIAGDWSPDGRVLVYTEVRSTTREDIWALPPGEEPTPLLRTPSRETAPTFSPDGRWLAYASDESGRHEVYVVRYPEIDRRAVVSSAGGREPMWSPRGGELFYIDERNWLTAVPMDAGRPAGSPEALFETSTLPDQFLHRTYDVAPDGRRFLLAVPIDETRVDRLYFVENWYEELERLVPAGR